jgi:hypothetical protein
MDQVEIEFSIIEKTLMILIFSKYTEIVEYYILHPESDEFGLAMYGEDIKKFEKISNKFTRSSILSKETIKLNEKELEKIDDIMFWVKDFIINVAREKKESGLSIEDEKILIQKIMSLKKKIELYRGPV